MQESTHVPQWLQLASSIVAGVLSGIGIDRLYNTWLNRKKPAAEINVTDATATEIHVRAGSTAGDAVIRMLARLDVAQETIDRLRAERDAWQDQYDEVFIQRDSLIHQNRRLADENKGYAMQVERMHLTLKNHNLNYDDTQDKPVQLYAELDKPRD
jgi:hypothetical protein